MEIDKLLKSTDILFQCIKQKVLKGQITTAFEWLTQQKEFVEKAISNKEITKEELKKYMESLYGKLYHLNCVCKDETVVNKNFLSLINELITTTKRYTD